MSRGHIAPITGLRYIKCKVLKMALVCVGVYSTYIVAPFLSDVPPKTIGRGVPSSNTTRQALSLVGEHIRSYSPRARRCM